MSDSPLRAIIGLGNPGSEYAQTRHNAGFWFVDRLADAYRGSFRREAKFHGELARVSISGQDTLLLKPGTFMNRSGLAAGSLAQFFKLRADDILVAHDELDLAVGTVRLKKAGGHGGHNGLRDLHRVLGAEYLRLRIGVGHPGQKELVMHYLTEQRTPKTEQEAIMAALMPAIEAVSVWLGGNWDKAVHQLHTQRDS
jgi:peptidyl-tRNA hydrolase, PTH1 family